MVNCSMDKIYLYKTAVKSVSYDETHWYINGEPQPQKDGDGIAEFKSNASAESFRIIANDIVRYTSHFKNVAVLTAAGTSMENGENGGKTRTELWDSYKEEIEAIGNALMATEGCLKEKCSSIIQSKNIEDFLSFTILYEKLNGEIKDKNGDSLRNKLEKKIADACRLKLDVTNKHHQDFIRKLTARKPSEARVQLYTTNYDTLFEQAAQKMNYTIIDGFSFSYPRIFNGANFNHDIVFREHTRVKQEESFIPNVIQLFKLHGSIDWEKAGDNIYQKESTEHPCIIYPASEKYESSYEQPYFEMMSHLQTTLRKEGTLLIVAGFGFQDKHIQNAIKEAVFQNPNFHLLIVCYGMKKIAKKEENEKEEWIDSGITHQLVPEYVSEDGKVMPNVTVLFSKFKAFVENYPYNDSYNINLPKNQDEAI